MSPAIRRIFSYDEALATFPVVRDRTGAAVRELEAILATDDEGEVSAAAADLQRDVVERWAAEIESLGCHVKGLWLVDWDAGDGCFCWKYPEPALGHYHGYDEGFAGRVPIA